MNTAIIGWGTAVPPGRVSQEDAASHAVAHWGAMHEQEKIIPKLYRLSGVKTRHSVVVVASSNGASSNGASSNGASSNGASAAQSFYQVAQSRDDLGPTTHQRMLRYEADALTLAEAAARAALTDADLPPRAITHLITVSCSGFHSPGVDIGLLERLGLARNTIRTHVGFMGCHGALNGLRLARAFSAADPEASVLVVCVELCSLHQQYSPEAELLVANSLFADGAAAVVCRAAIRGIREWCVVDQHSYVLPDTTELMGWRIGDHGFQMTLSAQVAKVVGLNLRDNLTDWLARRGLASGDIKTWAIHPGGPRILQACGEALGLRHEELDASREILARYGNMSSPTILFLLQELRRQQRPLPCVALAFGPGLTIEAALLDRFE